MGRSPGDPVARRGPDDEKRFVENRKRPPKVCFRYLGRCLTTRRYYLDPNILSIPTDAAICLLTRLRRVLDSFGRPY